MGRSKNGFSQTHLFAYAEKLAECREKGKYKQFGGIDSAFKKFKAMAVDLGMEEVIMTPNHKVFRKTKLDPTTILPDMRTILDEPYIKHADFSRLFRVIMYTVKRRLKIKHPLSILAKDRIWIHKAAEQIRTGEYEHRKDGEAKPKKKLMWASSQGTQATSSTKTAQFSKDSKARLESVL